jgi:hypothetical protein
VLLQVSMSLAWSLSVPNEVCYPRTPRVVEAVVKSPRNVADDPFHSLLVLRRCVLWGHKTPMLCSVHLLRRVVAA